MMKYARDIRVEHAAQVSHAIRFKLATGRGLISQEWRRVVPAHVFDLLGGLPKEQVGADGGPNTPTTTAAASALGVKFGQNVRNATSLHGSWTESRTAA